MFRIAAVFRPGFGFLLLVEFRERWLVFAPLRDLFSINWVEKIESGC